MSGSSRWPATSAASGTGTASRASSATTMRTATSRCSKSSTSCRRRSSPTAPRSSSTAATSASTSASTTARSSPPRFANVRWDEAIKRWRISTNRGDDIRARFVVMAQGPTTGRSCRASPGSRTSRATSSTRRAGTTTTPAATPTADCTSSPTSASHSSAPAPRACSWCRISAGMPSTSTCSSARRRRSTNAATRRPTRNGQVAAAGLAGGAQAQLPPLVAVRGCGVRRSRIWCATSGPNSAAT